MADHIHLIGADDVRAAGNSMRHAAEDMKSAASSIDGALERHRFFLDDWLQRFAALLEKKG